MENKKDSIPDGGTLSGWSVAIENMVGNGCKDENNAAADRSRYGVYDFEPEISKQGRRKQKNEIVVKIYCNISKFMLQFM